MQTFNYHTHTYRCGHASGKAEEYIVAAIKGGFHVIGFSEHLGFEGWDNPIERLAFDEVDEYLEEMYALKEKYKDKISVRVGFEFEYFEDKKEYLLEVQKKCDYMICGQHSYERKEGHDYNYAPFYGVDYIDYMASQICDAVSLGLCKYVAHPDYFMLAKQPYDKRYEKAIERIAKCCKKHGAVIEINLKGTKYGELEYEGVLSYMYPNIKTYEILAKEQVSVCFGYDAHHPSALMQREIENEVRQRFAHLGLLYVEKLQL